MNFDSLQNPFWQLETYFSNIYLEMLTTIKFTDLKVLNLQYTKVYSFQFLQLFNAPQLQQLSLENNDIANLKMLNKCSFPKLQRLRLNKIDNGINIYSQRFHCPGLNLCYINIQKLRDKNQLYFFHDQEQTGIRYPVNITKNLPYVLKSQNYLTIKSMYSITYNQPLLKNNLVEKVKQVNSNIVFLLSEQVLFDIFG